jgi:hypothetical protein
LTYQRGGHSWTFAWSAGDERAVFEAVIALASAERQTFDWFDAAAVSHGIGQAALEAAARHQPATHVPPAPPPPPARNQTPRTSV